jgi:Holliday junction resolvase RusA-like endonuclease
MCPHGVPPDHCADCMSDGQGSPAIDDHARVVGIAERLFGGAKFQSFVIEGNPPSKARPRFVKHGVVYSPSAKKERELSWIIKSQFPAPLMSNVFVVCVFFRGTKQRIDSDNMMKHFLDAATGVCWKDDSQVTAQLGIVEYDPARPRTVCVIGAHSSSMVRDACREFNCARCGAQFTSIQAKPKYCSRACASRSRGEDLSELVPCRRCQRPFKRLSASSTHCGQACRMADLQDAHKTRGPLPNCAVCRKPLSRHGYVRCRGCFETKQLALIQ